MNLLLLGGNSVANKEWIESVEQALKPLFAGTYVHRYRHWETGAELIDLEHELAQVERAAQGWGEYAIFAKSAGALLALKGIHEGRLNPAKCVFAGTAVKWGREMGFGVDSWLEDYTVPTLFIQKTGDPACSFADLALLLDDKSVQGAVLREVPGTDHHYENVELLKKEAADFI